MDVDGQDTDSFGEYSSLAADSRPKELYRSASLTRPSENYANYDLIAFLGLAQRLSVEFLPITWQKFRGLIGGGGQAKIGQALMNLRMSFAFKRFNHQSSQDPFQEVVQEIIVLACPAVRQHQYITQLEGICWNFTTTNEVWPVLIFEKTHLGDLYEFMRSDKGKSLSTEDRLDICIDIGIAIRDMHVNSIVHGDVKPSNVLVFQTSDGKYSAKVADFGYSTWFHSDDNPIQLPESVPWTAPEYQSQHFRPHEARRMDVYSYGLLCLWLIIGATYALSLPLPPYIHWAQGEFISFEEPRSRMNLLERWKRDNDNTFLEWATWLANGFQTTEEGLGEKLTEFFELTLAHEPSKRCTDFNRLFALLSSTRILPQPAQVYDSELVHQIEHFEIERSLFSLYSADFRLRSLIARGLEAVVSKSPSRLFSHTSPQTAAMQLALCYSLGFGLPRSNVTSMALLGAACLSEKDLEDKIQGIKVSDSSWPVRDGNFNTLAFDGFIRASSLARQYQEKNILPEAERNYAREIADVSAAVGEMHWLTALLQHDLARIYSATGRWEEAEELETQALETKMAQTTRKFFKLKSLSLLLSAYRTLGGFKKVKELAYRQKTTEELVDEQPIEEEIADGQIADKLDSDLVSLKAQVKRVAALEASKSMQFLAHIHTLKGQWKQAEKLEIDHISIGKRYLGVEHFTSFKSKAYLALTYWKQGRWKEAEVLQTQVLKVREEVLGADDPDTISIRHNLALTYLSQGRLEDAYHLGRQVQEMREGVLGADHPETLDGKGIISSVYKHQRRWKEAEKIDAEALRITEQTWGPEHPSTLICRSNLASAIGGQGRLGEAEALELEILKIRERVLGPDHPSTLITMANLAVTWKNQGRVGQALSLSEECLRRQIWTLGLEHPFVTAMCRTIDRWETDEGYSVPENRHGANISEPDHLVD